MNQRLIVCAALILGLFGCGKKPTAMEVCKKREVAGVAAKCREEKPGGLAAAAVERAEFDLPSVPGKGGNVNRFDKEEAFASTSSAFEGAALLAGPHRYGSKASLIFVQMNDGASLEVGKRAKDVVDALPGDSSGPPVSTSPPVASAPPEPKAAPVPAAAEKALTGVEVCAKLLAAGVARDCGKVTGGPLEQTAFGIAGMPGKNGTITRSTDGPITKYAGMVNALPPTSALRPFLVSEKAGVVVHLQPGATPAIVAKAKAAVDAL